MRLYIFYVIVLSQIVMVQPSYQISPHRQLVTGWTPVALPHRLQRQFPLPALRDLIPWITCQAAYVCQPGTCLRVALIQYPHWNSEKFTKMTQESKCHQDDSRWLSMTQGKSPRWLRQYLSDSRDGISTGTFHRHNRSKVPRYTKPGTHIKTCRGQKVSEATK